MLIRLTLVPSLDKSFFTTSTTISNTVTAKSHRNIKVIILKPCRTYWDGTWHDLIRSIWSNTKVICAVKTEYRNIQKLVSYVCLLHYGSDIRLITRKVPRDWNGLPDYPDDGKTFYWPLNFWDGFSNYVSILQENVAEMSTVTL